MWFVERGITRAWTCPASGPRPRGSAAAPSPTCRWAPTRGTGKPIPAPTVDNGLNPAPADRLPGTPPPLSDPLQRPRSGTVQCNGQQPNPCVYTRPRAAHGALRGAERQGRRARRCGLFRCEFAEHRRRGLQGDARAGRLKATRSRSARVVSDVQSSSRVANAALRGARRAGVDRKSTLSAVPHPRRCESARAISGSHGAPRTRRRRRTHTTPLSPHTPAARTGA